MLKVMSRLCYEFVFGEEMFLHYNDDDDDDDDEYESDEDIWNVEPPQPSQLGNILVLEHSPLSLITQFSSLSR
jgi:hypothetical protein